MLISGLTYIESVLPESIADDITDWFFSEGTQETLIPLTKSLKSRKVLHFGYKYDYIKKTIYEKADPMPPIIEQLLDYIPMSEGANAYFNQCIINQYLPGQGITPHIDRTSYGSTIACFTFGKSGREMHFSRSGRNSIKLYTTPGSLYIMQGDARYMWKHSMKGRLHDMDSFGKQKILRKKCFSVTFRNVPPKPPSAIVV